jgi:hypothetical protein
VSASWLPGLALLLCCGCQQTLVVGHDPPDAATSPALAVGLLAWWRLDEAPGSLMARDSAGHGNDAVPEAVSDTDWIPGRFGGALQFGNAGWLRTTDPGPIDAIRDGLTIALWIRIADLEDREQVILQRQLGTGADAHFLLSLAQGRPALSGEGLARCEGSALPTGAWVALAAVADGAGERVYVDGAESANCPGVAAFAADDTGITVGGGQIGPSPFSVDRRLRADLDEVLLYSRVLPPTELGALAAGQLPQLP